eukprot:Skav234101  [mRNA]  locus=scaffold183:160956:161552:- [translate_table: standard]
MSYTFGARLLGQHGPCAKRWFVAIAPDAWQPCTEDEKLTSEVSKRIIEEVHAFIGKVSSSDKKLSNGDVELICFAMFQCTHHCLKTATSPTFLVDFELTAKPLWSQDVFQKALLRPVMRGCSVTKWERLRTVFGLWAAGG